VIEAFGVEPTSAELNRLSYTLVTDGSSDQVLKYPIDWLLRVHSERPFAGEWANPWFFPRTTKGLRSRIGAALTNHPC
jgi:hypothetical protein